MASIPAARIVDEGFRLALTGTPGTGKSTVAGLLSKTGFQVLTVESLAEQNDLKGYLDLEDGALVIDTDALHQALSEPPITGEPHRMVSSQRIEDALQRV